MQGVKCCVNCDVEEVNPGGVYANQCRQGAEFAGHALTTFAVMPWSAKCLVIISPSQRAALL